VRTPLAIVGGLVLLVSASARPAAAQEAAPAPAASLTIAEGSSEAFRLTEDVLRSLVWARAAGEALLSSRTAGPIHVSLTSRTAQHRAVVNLRTASSMLATHAVSPRKEVRNAAVSLRLVYDLLLEGFEGSLDIEEKLAGVTAKGSLEQLARDANACAIVADKAWGLLPIAAAILTDALVDATSGQAPSLMVTAGEKADLLEQIDRFFGPDAAAGRMAGLHPTAGSAARIAAFLRGSGSESDQR